MFGKKKRESVLVRRYATTKEFQKDANKLAKDGWKVHTQTESSIGKGLIAGALTHGITVTYMRD